MIINEFKFIPYSLKLKTPFVNSSFTIDKREGFIVKITDESGLVGFGEVAPLQGFSLETMEKCESELNRLYYSIIAKSAKDEPFDLGTELEALSNLPSLRFGIEQAIISLLTEREELTTLLQKDTIIKVNGVVGIGSQEHTLKTVDNLLANDFKTIKVKVGGSNFNEDIELIETITKRIDDSIKIRIDVNGNWSYNNTEHAVGILDKSKIELIEQPVNNINELVMLSDFSPIPIAVDEIIKNGNDAKELIERSNIKNFVLKPSILGGVIETIGLIKSAETMNKKVIISSAFESVVGRSMVGLLASLIDGDHAHGINTASFFEKDLCHDTYPVKNGIIDFKYQEYPPKFDGISI
jgi:o-succinylbenzoate synthase